MKGGVIKSEAIRIQARHISYTRKKEGAKALAKVEASGDLMLEFGDRIFVGERIEYDFTTESGLLFHGRTAAEPWYMGADVIMLHADGSYTLDKGFLTTCEHRDASWQIAAHQVHFSQGETITAEDITVRLLRIPVMWIPHAKGEPGNFLKTPIRTKFYWGGSQGARIGLDYGIFTWQEFRAFLRLDYRFRRGLGGGIDTEYAPAERDERLFTRNYVAYDTRIDDDTRRRMGGRLDLRDHFLKSDGQLVTALDKEAEVVALDPMGKSVTSEMFTTEILASLVRGGSRLAIAIGGAEGLPEEVRRRYPMLSLSSLTFTHQMTRLILAEQLYRMLEIDRGSSYHK